MLSPGLVGCARIIFIQPRALKSFAFVLSLTLSCVCFVTKEDMDHNNLGRRGENKDDAAEIPADEAGTEPWRRGRTGGHERCRHGRRVKHKERK